jgi:RNA polymerase sigma factor (sigma-70 family)
MSQPNRNEQCQTDRLVEDHMGFARSLARRMTAMLAMPVDRDALESDAMLGLLMAARCFDPDRGVAFSTYAAKRIRGAMLDGLCHRSGYGRDRGSGKPRSLPGRMAGADVREMPLAELTDLHREQVGTELERQDELGHLLGGLSAGQRRMVHQFYFEHLTQEQIGRLLGISASRVCQKLKSAYGCMAELACAN